MRILIDLTDIEKWSGSHGGIQRVVYGIAKEFYLDSNNAFELRFISFSEINNNFVYSAFDPIYERVELQQDDEVAATSKGPVLSIRQKARLAVRTKVPESIRKNTFARVAFKGSLKAGKGAFHKLTAIKSRPAETRDCVTFTENDTILILGKPWDNLKIQNRLSLEKQQVNFKLVQVVYDLIISLQPHLHHPDLFEPYNKHMFEAVAASDLLLPISKSSDRDLGEFCNQLALTKPRTNVIRLGDELKPGKSMEGSKPDNKIAAKFILCVGTVEIRKNHSLLYSTYKLAEEKGIDLPQLVIVGGKGWLSGDIRYLISNDPAMKQKILMLHNINDIELMWLYENCQFTVYPSMYEGWGLPIAESLAYGKVCVTSKTSSMTEIAGPLIPYFSPYDAQECLKEIVKLKDREVLKKYEGTIKQTYKPTSWRNTYDQTLKAIKKL